jgi:hypothetical protein
MLTFEHGDSPPPDRPVALMVEIRVAREADGLRLRTHVDPRRGDPAAARYLLDAFVRVLDAFADDPARPVGQLDNVAAGYYHDHLLGRQPGRRPCGPMRSTRRYGSSSLRGGRTTSR